MIFLKRKKSHPFASLKLNKKKSAVKLMGNLLVPEKMLILKGKNFTNTFVK